MRIESKRETPSSLTHSSTSFPQAARENGEGGPRPPAPLWAALHRQQLHSRVCFCGASPWTAASFRTDPPSPPWAPLAASPFWSPLGMVLACLAASPGLFSHKLPLQNPPIKTWPHKTNTEGYQGTGRVVAVLFREIFPREALRLPGFSRPAAQCF